MSILKSKNKKNNQYKSPISIKTNIDINKIVVFNKVSFGKNSFRYFMGYKDTKIRPLCIFLPKIRAPRRDFDETKYMSFLITMMNYYKNIMKFGKALEIVSKKSLIGNLCARKNIWKLKQNLVMEKATQIFTIIKYQKKVLNLFADQ